MLPLLSSLKDVLLGKSLPFDDQNSNAATAMSTSYITGSTVQTFLLNSFTNSQLTLDEDSVPNSSHYTGSVGVLVRNGHKLPIFGIRSSTLHSSDNYVLTINNHFHSSHTSTNLLSV